MATLVLNMKKSIEENASDYYDKAKKLKKKITGAEEALKKSRKKLKQLEAKKEKYDAEEQIKTIAKQRKKEWYEKFRWFKSSDNFLIIGGRDATSNEIVIKKHTEKDDLVLHTDMAGSPFFVIKAQNKKIPKTTIKEAADATCTFSRAWKLGLQTSDVFYVSPDQVSKEAQSGEYLTKGAFMIRGKTNYIDNKMNLAIGIAKGKEVMAGPLEAVKKHCKKYITLQQGDEKVSSIAKKINHKFNNTLDLDEIIRVLPAGNFKISG
jgi:predicted ribosome quality control (RQC) complex YloA/Tae2 family protein